MVQRTVVNVEAAGPSSAQKKALAARAQKAIGPGAVPRREVGGRSVKPDHDAALSVLVRPLVMGAPDAVEHRFQPGNLAVRIVLVRRKQSHRFRRSANDVVANPEVFNLLAAVVPEALRRQRIVSAVKDKKVAPLEAKRIVEVRTDAQKIVVKPPHPALDAYERSDLIAQCLVEPVTQEPDEQGAEPQQHREFEREIPGLD